MTQPLLRLPRKIPQDQREWEQFLQLMNRWFRTDGDKAIVDSTATLSNRTSTNLSTVLQRIGDAGRATDQRLLPLVNAASKLSTQSAQPLTASESGGVATINVAAHSVQFGFGTVAYNAGSISGLDTSTSYYVYADDPDYEGGAVTYLATTNPLTVTASDDRYYLGRITTPSGGGGPTSGGWGGGGGGGGTQIP